MTRACLADSRLSMLSLYVVTMPLLAGLCCPQRARKGQRLATAAHPPPRHPCVAFTHWTGLFRVPGESCVRPTDLLHVISLGAPLLSA
jgi:hypothetical protein